MYRSACLLLALVATCYGAALPSSRIVGGSLASTNQIPWQVSLRGGSNNHFCGGSIINQRWILTAAHCLTPSWISVSTTTVVTGSLTLHAGGDRYRASRFVIHAQHNQQTLRHDVGLIQVASNIIYRNNVQPARLPTSHFTAVGAQAVVSGWGQTSHPGWGSNNLLFINTFTTSQAHCRTTSWTVTDENICTFTRHGQGTCMGDSGGPLTANGIQIGIVSFGRPCGIGFPDAYARVFTYLNWIRSFTG